MNLWGSNSVSTNSAPQFAASSLQLGSGRTAQAANLTSLVNNTSPGAFTPWPKEAIGLFSVDQLDIANTNSEGPKAKTAGWSIRRAFEGPVVSVAGVSGNGTNFANGETVLLSNGTSNSIVTISTNSTGGIVGGSVANGGGLFANSSLVVLTFSRELHVNTISVTSGSNYLNTDYIVCSNGTVNAIASLTTNATGGFTNASIVISNPGFFANTIANNQVVVSVKAANGAVSNGSGASLSANLNSSTSGSLTLILGGRSGRVTYEPIVALGSLSSSTKHVP